ncbi:MAG: BCCT family transporter [Bacteroidota bacterium]
MSKLRHGVFWPPFLFLLASAIYSFLSPKRFEQTVTSANSWILGHLGWLFSAGVLFFLIVVLWAYVSPIGSYRIGGPQAKPILSRWRWFTITLCTTIAVGILFWGTGEPLYHYHAPASGLGIPPTSPASARFAMSTMFMHWTIIPYGIYTLAGLMFALVYYNLRQPFSLGSMLVPLLGKQSHGTLGKVVDAVCLYSLVAGMAASLGAGILSISGGLNTILGIPKSALLLAIISMFIVGTFIISAASGLQKGIRYLSDLNIKGFIGLFAFFFILGPTSFFLSLGVEGIGEFLQSFFSRSLYTGVSGNDPWPQNWTIFYWANWLAWTPVTALFLGRLAVGYTVKEYIQYNLFFPSLFGAAWMMVFGGTALHLDMAHDHALYGILQDTGVENVIFRIFEEFPLPVVVSGFFLLMTFLSYVTAADSNTTAMGGISSVGISPDSPEPPLWIKIAWGITIGLIAWIMVSFAGLEGIKMTSNLGGLPALFLVFAIALGMIRLIRKPEQLTGKTKQVDAATQVSKD